MTMLTVPPNAALLLIDLQKAIDHPSWGQRNNRDAEATVARLLAVWRDRRMPLWHIRHDSIVPRSTYRPGQPLHDFKAETAPLAGERVIGKQTPSAFVKTLLESELDARGIDTLVVAGVITNNSVEATVRHAGALGFTVYLVEDGCFTFGRRDWLGNWRTADEVHAMSLANLHDEYATVVRASDVTSAIQEASAASK